MTGSAAFRAERRFGYLGQYYGATVPFLLGAAVVAVGLVVLLSRFGEFRLAEPEPAASD